MKIKCNFFFRRRGVPRQAAPAAMAVLLSAAAALVLAGSCSVVFTASVSGEVIDKESWEESEQSVGIGDVEIYLYTDELLRNTDYSRYIDSGLRPDEVDAGQDPRYFVSTVSGADGTFTFNGLIWNDFLPQYGKSGDRQELFFLFYNRDYGLTKNPVPVFIVSDVTNRLPAFKLERITNSARIEGTVVNKNTGNGVGAVNLELFVAEAFDDPVSPTTVTYPEDPDYVTTTAPDGSYGLNISFPKDLGDSAFVKITAGRNSFNCDDYDDDGTTADGTTPADDYLEAGPAEKDKTYTATDIEIKQTEFIATLEGRVVEPGTSTGVNWVTVWLFYTEETSPSDLPADENPDTNMPDDSTYTQSRPVNDTTVEEGYFIFPGIEWTDPDYTGNFSTRQVWLYRPTADEISAGELIEPVGGTRIDSYTLRSTGDNWVVIDND